MHPEVSGDERETSLYLYQLLGDEGFDVRVGNEGRGVVADIPPDTSDLENDLIALRADIDALCIHDAKQVEYRSQCDGVMHACGHDAHTALVFGAITALNELRLKRALPWPVRMRGIFQPAEETCQGAKEMIDVGVLDGVQAILASHVDPSRCVGRVGMRDVGLSASCDDMHIVISGTGGHAARPHETSDPIAAAAQFINSLYLFVPRAIDSQDAVVVTIGCLSGGDNANVIPEEVVLRGTVRTLDVDVRRQTFTHIRRLASGIGQTTGTNIDVRFGNGSPSINNDKQLTQCLRESSRAVVGKRCVDEIPRASMGSEDFSFYLEKVPGAMIRLGCAPLHAPASPLHTPAFDVDEEVLRIGAKILAHSAILCADPQLCQTRNS